MAEGQVETTIDRSADEVWKIVSDFGALHTWMPAVESCRLEGDDRVLSMLGMEIVEHLVRRDDDARVLAYSIVGGQVPVDRHMATITVTPGAEGSAVTWAYEVEPDSMGDVFHQSYEASVAALKSHAETAE